LRFNGSGRSAATRGDAPIDDEIAAAQHGWKRRRPTRERLDPRDELGEREGLREVVVGPEIQAFDAVPPPRLPPSTSESALPRGGP